MKKKIGVIGQFPPPIHGLSKALDTLYKSYLNEEFDLKKIDITNNKKFISNIFKILVSNLDLYYLTISQSKFGNIRDLIMIKLIQLKKRKIIIHLHGGGFRNILDNEFGEFQKKMNYKILAKIDGGIVLGNSLRYIFEGIIPKDKIFVVKNCVDDEFVITDNEFNEKISFLENKSKFKILYLSNFIEDKGYKDVLKLAKLVKEKNDDRFKFVFAGNFFSEHDKNEFFEYIKLNNLESIIDYRGIISGENKLNTLKECDYFILLTRYKNEGQPISIIEAAANGIKIITTNHAGILDILDTDRMIVLDKNKIEVSDILEKVYNEFDNRNGFISLVKESRKIILEDFSEKSYLRELETIFNIV